MEHLFYSFQAMYKGMFSLLQFEYDVFWLDFTEASADPEQFLVFLLLSSKC